MFYGCLKYPACDFVTWNKPVPEQCPQCGSPYLLEKSTKKEGLVRYCNEESCEYKVPLEAKKFRKQSQLCDAERSLLPLRSD